MFTFTITQKNATHTKRGKKRNETNRCKNNIPYAQMLFEIESEAEIVTANIEYV